MLALALPIALALPRVLVVRNARARIHSRRGSGRGGDNLVRSGCSGSNGYSGGFGTGGDGGADGCEGVGGGVGAEGSSTLRGGVGDGEAGCEERSEERGGEQHGSHRWEFWGWCWWGRSRSGGLGFAVET